MKRSVNLSRTRRQDPVALALVQAIAERDAARAALLDEREACAKIAETYRRLWGSTVEGSQDPGPTIAAAIRARPATPPAKPEGVDE